MKHRISIALAALLFNPIQPALAAGFHPEDLGWLALVRHIDSPWPLLTENVFFVYYYRPVGLLLEQLSEDLLIVIRTESIVGRWRGVAHRWPRVDEGS